MHHDANIKETQMTKKTQSRPKETERRTGRLMWGDEDDAQTVGRVVQDDDGTYELFLNPGVRLDSRDRDPLWIKFDPA